MAQPKSKFIRFLKLALGFAVTVLFVYLIVAKLEWKFVAKTIAGAKVEWLVAALICFVINAFFRIVRWWQILHVKAPNLKFRACIWPYLLCTWLNIVIPFRAGDFVRAFGFRKQLMSPASRILGLLVVERVLDLVAVLIVFFVCLVSVVDSEVIPKAFSTAALVIAAMAVMGLICLIFLNKPIRYLVRIMTGLSFVSQYEISHKLRTWMDHFFEGVSTIRQPFIFSSVVFLTAVMWSLEGLTYYLVAIAVGAAEPPMASWFAFATAALATAIPSTPGFIGTFDYFAALGMSAFGIDWNTGTAFAVIVHIVVVLPFALVMLGYGLYKLLITVVQSFRGTAPEKVESEAPATVKSTD